MKLQALVGSIVSCLALAGPAAVAAIPAPAPGQDSSSGVQLDRDAAKELAKRSSGDFPEPKHFKEAPGFAHYDARFMKNPYPLEEDEQRAAIKVLIQTYLATFRDLGVQTWLMHGSLLGWWWGKQTMPWDLDADVQVTEADMYFLAAYHNMTIYYYRYGSLDTGRFFLLEINPHFKHREQDDILNFIDARWIDMETGLFIDITAARYDLDHPAGEGMLYDKHGHQYRDTYVFPLRNTTFEGVPALIPYRYRDLLASEYGEKALKNTKFHDHEYDEELERWIPDEEL